MSRISTLSSVADDVGVEAVRVRAAPRPPARRSTSFSVSSSSRVETESPGQRTLSVVGERRLHADVAARLIDRVVDEGEMAMRKHRQPVRTQRVDGHDARGERLVDRRHVLLGRREHDRNRLQLDDRHDAGGGARMDDVAGIDEAEAGLPVKRRADRRVAQLRLGVVDRAPDRP